MWWCRRLGLLFLINVMVWTAWFIISLWTAFFISVLTSSDLHTLSWYLHGSSRDYASYLASTPARSALVFYSGSQHGTTIICNIYLLLNLWYSILPIYACTQRNHASPSRVLAPSTSNDNNLQPSYSVLSVHSALSARSAKSVASPRIVSAR